MGVNPTHHSNFNLIVLKISFNSQIIPIYEFKTQLKEVRQWILGGMDPIVSIGDNLQ